MPTRSLRLIMKLRPLRSFCMNAARSTAISTHAPQPRESSRLRKCPGHAHRSACDFLASHVVDPAHPPARQLAVHQVPSAFAIGSSGRPRAFIRQLAKPTASLRLIMKLRPLRSFCMNVAFDRHLDPRAPAARELAVETMWPAAAHRLHLAGFSAQSADQHTQPRERLRLRKVGERL